MYKLKDFEFSSVEISYLVNVPHKGRDIVVTNVQNLGEQKEKSIIVCYDNNKDLLLSIEDECLVFCSEKVVIDRDNLSYIVTDTPKYDFFNFINNYLLANTDYWIAETVSETSDKFPGVKFGYNVQIGTNVVIAPGTYIGSNCVIGVNVVIKSNVSINENTIIKDNTVIGSEGFGFTRKDGKTIHVPQIGGIEIGADVIIGSNCTVERPALGTTLIEDNVKIDDLVQIGHNYHIGEGTIITSGFKAVGGCKIGRNCFIGIGAIITSKKAVISDNCVIGAGAIITKPIPENSTVYNKIETVIVTGEDRTNEMLGAVRKV